MVLTRLGGGKTPMPPGEEVREFAKHGTTMAVFLSAARSGQLVRELLEGGYPTTTPVVVAYQATWPEELVVKCTTRHAWRRPSRSTSCGSTRCSWSVRPWTRTAPARTCTTRGTSTGTARPTRRPQGAARAGYPDVITVIGTGTGAPVPDAAVAGAGLVVGGRRHLDAVRLPEGAERIVLGPLAPALDAMEPYVEKDRPVVVLASGDPGFFGIVRALAERFGTERLDVRAGVSSVAAAFARAGLPWDDAVVVSAHGREPRTAVNVCRAHPKVAVLTGPGAAAELGAALRDTGRILVVASALGDPARERVERVTPAEAADRDWGTAVSVVLSLDPERALGAVRTVAGPPARPAGGPWTRRSSHTATP
ncbi:hypothetical protein SGLAM104S_10201 [Streptomyces glaucescens]